MKVGFLFPQHLKKSLALEVPINIERILNG